MWSAVSSRRIASASLYIDKRRAWDCIFFPARMLLGNCRVKISLQASATDREMQRQRERGTEENDDNRMLTLVAVPGLNRLDQSRSTCFVSYPPHLFDDASKWSASPPPPTIIHLTRFFRRRHLLQSSALPRNRCDWLGQSRGLQGF